METYDAPDPLGPAKPQNTPKPAPSNVPSANVRERMGSGQAAMTAQFMDPEPGEARVLPNGNEVLPGQWQGSYEDPVTGLPKDCPVVPLGRDGDIFYLFNAFGTETSFTSKSTVNKQQVQSWFAPRLNYAPWMAPPVASTARKEVRNPANFDHDKIVYLMQAACCAKGSWTPMTKIRGRGCWRSGFNKLIYHMGDKLLMDGVEHDPGEYDLVLYPRGERLPRPWPTPVAAAPGGGADAFLQNLHNWNWKDAYAPELTLAALCCGLIGGYLQWRPHLSIQGVKGSGKTFLQSTFRLAMGRLMFGAANPTAPGIYQPMAYDSLAVGLDEAENDPDARTKLSDILDLARIASTGDAKPLGTADGKGKTVLLRSSFLMTGISSPPFKDSDLQRWTVLRIDAHENKKPETDGAVIAGWGRQILRRMIDHAPRFDAVRAIFRARLMLPVSEGGAGLDARMADQQYGHLLAAQHIALYDHDPTEADLSRWCGALSQTVAKEDSAAAHSWQDCLDYLLDKAPDAWRTRAYKTVRGLLHDFLSDRDHGNLSLKAVRDQLDDLGLCLIFDTTTTVTTQCYGNAWLLVPNKHPGLSDDLFAGSPWKSKANSSGQWHSLLEQADPGMVKTKKNASRKGKSRYGNMLRVAEIIEIEHPAVGVD